MFYWILVVQSVLFLKLVGAIIAPLRVFKKSVCYDFKICVVFFQPSKESYASFNIPYMEVYILFFFRSEFKVYVSLENLPGAVGNMLRIFFHRVFFFTLGTKNTKIAININYTTFPSILGSLNLMMVLFYSFGVNLIL